MPRRTGRLPAEYMKTAWWVYRHPLRAAGGVAGAFALAAWLGAALGGRRRRR